MAILGAIYGDICGSTYEFHHEKDLNRIKLMQEDSHYTDDTVMTIAILHALTMSENAEAVKKNSAEMMRYYGNSHPHRGYGGMFKRWLADESIGPYNSYGNGSAMRVSAVGDLGRTLGDTLCLATATAAPTHNHPEGIKGAMAVAGSIYIARNTKDRDLVRKFITDVIGYNIDFTCDDIREDYYFDETCQGSVPQAIVAALEADSVSEAIKLAISLGGDADTQAAIAGGIAEELYGWTDEEKQTVPEYVRKILAPWGAAQGDHFEHFAYRITDDDYAEGFRRRRIAQEISSLIPEKK